MKGSGSAPASEAEWQAAFRERDRLEAEEAKRVEGFWKKIDEEEFGLMCPECRSNSVTIKGEVCDSCKEAFDQR